MERNTTINSADEIHKIEKYPDDYNVRKVKRQKKLSKAKQNAFTALCALFQDNNKKYKRLMSIKKR